MDSMKYTLTINTDEKAELNQAVNGVDAYAAMWDIKQLLREKLKYKHLSAMESEIIEELQEEILLIIEDTSIGRDFI